MLGEGQRKGPLYVLGLLVLAACGDATSDTPAVPGPTEGDPPPAPTPSGTATGTEQPPTTPPATGACSGKTGTAGDRNVTLTSGGRERNFDLHVPATYDATKRTPLVFVFHGYTQDAKGIASATRFAKVADAHGMIVAFPNGVGNSWNAGDCCGTGVSQNIDDVGFVRDMIKSLAGEYCVDEKRVFSTGFSNGGYMSYRLACELSDAIAAAAPVSGGIRMDPAVCNPKRPIALFHAHGTNDLIVPYNGGGLSGSRPVSDAITAFRTKNKCPSGDGTVYYEKDDVSCRRWSTCEAGTAVELCTIAGGGHQWPGGEALPYGGSPTKNLDASEAIAKFFEAHPMP